MHGSQDRGFRLFFKKKKPNDFHAAVFVHEWMCLQIPGEHCRHCFCHIVCCQYCEMCDRHCEMCEICLVMVEGSKHLQEKQKVLSL